MTRFLMTLDESVDLVSLHLVLHYLDAPLTAIREAARVLKQHGRLAVIDFAPHTLEQLRELHAHRRLGFMESEVSGWCAQAELSVLNVRHLPPVTDNGLTVSIWLAQKNAGVLRTVTKDSVSQREVAS